MARFPWIATAVLTLAATSAAAAPLPVVPGDTLAPGAPVERVQYYGYPYGYGPPLVYYGRPRRVPGYGYPAPRGYGYPGPYGSDDKEAAKDYVKGYRRGQKEILKDRARAWNRANGF